MKYFLVILFAFLSAGAMTQTRKMSIQRKSITQHKKVVKPPVEVKDEVIKIDFSINSNGNFIIQSGEKYYIVPFSKKNANELYNDMLVRIARLYKSPERVAEKIENRTIVINGYANQIATYSYTLDYVKSDTKFRSIVDLSYKLEFNFKDGKIRINPPLISGGEEISLTTGSRYDGVHMDSIYKHDKDAIKKIEVYFNDLITALVYGNEIDEDW